MRTHAASVPSFSLLAAEPRAHGCVEAAGLARSSCSRSDQARAWLRLARAAWLVLWRLAHACSERARLLRTCRYRYIHGQPVVHRRRIAPGSGVGARHTDWGAWTRAWEPTPQFGTAAHLSRMCPPPAKQMQSCRRTAALAFRRVWLERQQHAPCLRPDSGTRQRRWALQQARPLTPCSSAACRGSFSTPPVPRHTSHTRQPVMLDTHRHHRVAAAANTTAGGPPPTCPCHAHTQPDTDTDGHGWARAGTYRHTRTRAANRTHFPFAQAA